jgi:putative ABC transport system permease protein
MKHSFKLAIRQLFKKGSHKISRIVSLTLGLTFGLLILSEVFYYYSFDGYFRDADQLYLVYESYKSTETNEKTDLSESVSGGVASGFNTEVPGVVVATRLNDLGSQIFYNANKQSFKADFVLADEYWQDVFGVNMVYGNAKEILSTANSCILASDVAEKMGGNIIGKVIELKQYPGVKLNIQGIFEALPENTSYKYDALISIVSTKQFMWDGTNNWIGNDRYYTCVKLQKGVKPESLKSAIRQMQEKHQDITALEEQQGIEFNYILKPLKNIYAGNVKKMIIVLSTIGVAILLISILNYILLSLSALIKKSKSSAIYKTCGAQSTQIQQLIFSETLVLFLISLIATFLCIELLQPFIENQVGHRLSSLLTFKVVLPLVAVVGLLFFITSYIPAKFFASIPIVVAFRNYQQKRNKWKLVLLSFQFIGSAFIIMVLTVVNLQYNKMKNADHGYQTKNIYYSSTSGLDGNKLGTILSELRNMPEIKRVGFGAELPINDLSGNNIFAPDGEKELFNVADFYYIDHNYLSILGIKTIEGECFTKDNAIINNILISAKGADLLTRYNGWDQGVIGKNINITGHNNIPSTITGVFPDFVITSLADADTRPAVFFYLPEERFKKGKIEHPSYNFNILIKTSSTAGNNIIEKIKHIINLGLPNKDAIVKSLEEEQELCYQAEEAFRNAMLLGSLAVLLITLIGLVGYTSNEADRRGKEMAIRKINGASTLIIFKIVIGDLEKIAIPATAIGLMLAWITANKWMETFASKITLHWSLFFITACIVILVISGIATFNFLRMINRNPIEDLRSE